MKKKIIIFGGRDTDRNQETESGYFQPVCDPDYEQPADSQEPLQHWSVSLTQEELDSIASDIGREVIHFLSQQNLSGNAPSRQERSDFEEHVFIYLEQLFKGITSEDKATGKKYFIAHKVLKNQDDSFKMLNTLSARLQALQQAIDNQSKLIEQQSAIIKMQHETISRYENDVIYKTQKDLIMELIGIADQLKYTLNDHSQGKNFDSLYSAIGDLLEWVNGSLQAVAVRQYVGGESKELDRKRQEIIEAQETSNPNEDGMIKSILPGYIWSVPLVGSSEMQQTEERPKVYEFMIRPEQVACLKYVKTEDEPLEPLVQAEEELMDESAASVSQDVAEDGDKGESLNEQGNVSITQEDRSDEDVNDSWGNWYI